MTHKKTIVLFDFDGTIADTGEMVLTSLLHVLEHVRPGQYDRRDLIDYLGLPLREQFLRLLPDADPEPLIDMYRTYQKSIFATHLAPVPGMQKVLETLYAYGVPMGIVTSRQRASTEHALEQLGWTHFFQTVVGFEDVYAHKPHPEPLHTALMRLGVHVPNHEKSNERVGKSSKATVFMPDDRATVYYVGDQPVDVQAARAAGVRSILVGWSIARPELFSGLEADVFLSEPRALLSLLLKDMPV